MIKIILITYAHIFAAYAATYHADYQITYPYKPFKLKKKTGVFSKYICICKDRWRGMVNITFYLQMLAHCIMIISPILLYTIYTNQLYKIPDFIQTYSIILVSATFLVFGISTLSAVGLNKIYLWMEKRR